MSNSKSKLDRSEWDFSGLARAPRSVVHRALMWELDRELGSGKPAYLETAEGRRALAEAKRSGGVKTESGVVEVQSGKVGVQAFEEARTFRIDWSQPREMLLKNFSRWLDAEEKSGRMLKKSILGKPRQPLTLLKKVSITRLKKDGHSIRTANAAFDKNQRPYINSLEKINWTTASREIDAALQRRRSDHKQVERQVGKGWKTFLYPKS